MLEFLFWVFFVALLVDLRLILWSLERPQYVLRRRKMLTWKQRARATLAHWVRLD